jgi:thiol-disulfide isomerase/thioredoxin
MLTRKGLIFLVTGMALGVLLGVLTLMPGARSNPDPVIGVQVENFVLQDLEDRPVRLNQYRGKVVVLNFWATWCVPCKDEMPLLQKYSNALKSKVVVIGINSQESISEIKAFVDANAISFPIILDSSGEILRKFLVHNYPTTFFIDPNGILRDQHIGTLSDDLMNEYLRNAGVNP